MTNKTELSELLSRTILHNENFNLLSQTFAHVIDITICFVLICARK